MRGPIRQAPLATQVAREFRRLIRDGEWPVGSRIPGELELTEQLGVSRATVREALRALTGTGLLEAKVGDGTYVRARDEITGVLVRDEPTPSLSEVLDARAGLEAAAARLAARQATPEALQEMTDSLVARDRAEAQGAEEDYVIADARFHRAVVTASGNAVLMRLHAAVEGVLEDSIRDTTVLPEPPELTALHRRLDEQVRDGRSAEAAETAYALMDEVRRMAGVTRD